MDRRIVLGLVTVNQGEIKYKTRYAKISRKYRQENKEKTQCEKLGMESDWERWSIKPFPNKETNGI